MFFPPFNEEVSRYERKFQVTDMIYPAVEQQIRLHPSAFSPLFHPRYINNIYLDTPIFESFYDNIFGKGSRKKVRIRWYGEVNGLVEKPIVEFKIREGMLGNKLSFPLTPFVVDHQFSIDRLNRVFHESNLPDWVFDVLVQLKPALLNRYRRQYFMTFDSRFRLTIDNELQYFGIGINNNNFLENHRSEDIIVELKYDRKYDDIATKVTNALPFRLTKSSKYVNGIELLHPMLV
jgi:SPX domain protein involved in polyphosphate accumulation